MNRKNRKQTNNRKKVILPIRLNILFLLIFAMFATLIVQLGYLQIVEGRNFTKQLNEKNEVVIEKPVPRGRILDRNGEIIVDNEPKYAITYTRTNAVTTKEMLETAEKLAKLITVDTSKLRERDEKDYWIAKNPERVKELLTKKEIAELNTVTTKEDRNKVASQTYKMQLERVPLDEIDSYPEEVLQVIAIYKTFNNGYALSLQMVKNDNVSLAEFSAVSEHLSELPGVDTLVDWDRKYNFGTTLKSMLGRVTSAQEGIPEESLEYYLSKGYKRNDRVGKSYLEQQYEELLSGEKERTTYALDKKGRIVSTLSHKDGIRGKDLVLTIDMHLQQEIEKIVTEELIKQKRKGASYLDRAFAVVADPRNGELLAIVGKNYVKNPETGEVTIEDMALGAFTTAYEMGSTVKGATLLTGYAEGVIRPGSTQIDEPIYIAGTPKKSSYAPYDVRGMGRVSDLDALRRSSNVYMFKTAIDIGKGNYVPNGSLKINETAFDKFRNHFAQFGLGVKTGLDLPNEQIGYKGKSTKSGFLLDLSIGQFDTYTPLQMVQYVSTIANGGDRLALHVLKEAYNPATDSNKLGALYLQTEPKVLNKVTNSEAEINQVKEGFRQVTQSSGGTAYGRFKNSPYKPAGKTGTAQAFYVRPDRLPNEAPAPTYNLTFISYAPYTAPEMAMAVVVPWAGSSSINMDIAQKVQEAYFISKNQPFEKENIAISEEEIDETVPYDLNELNKPEIPELE